MRVDILGAFGVEITLWRVKVQFAR